MRFKFDFSAFFLDFFCFFFFFFFGFLVFFGWSFFLPCFGDFAHFFLVEYVTSLQL